MTRTANPGLGTFALPGIAAFFRNWREARAKAARRNRAYHRTFAALDGMSDSDLADIGIPRLMIADIAAEQAARA